MKMKLVFGMSVICAGAAFWACGDGQIINPSGEDDLMKSMVGDIDFKVQVADAMAQCQANEACNAEMVRANRGAVEQQNAEESSSSAWAPVGLSLAATSSASAPMSQIVINPTTPTSSATLVGPTNPVSSASTLVISGDVADPGTCKPSKNPINKGETVSWTFNRGSGFSTSEVMQGSFAWKFEGATPAEFSGTGTKGITAAGITYSNSGKFGATLVAAKPSGAGATLQCEPLQVNGAPITGCKCAATNATANLKGVLEVDVAETQSVEYAVTGCSSMGQQITGYTWNGATGADNAGSAAIAEKSQAVKPTVAVSNDDNTEIQVECPQVVAIDSRVPDYVFELENASQIPNTALDVKDGGCMNITGTWGNAGYNPSVQVLCSMKATSTPVSFSMKYGTKTYSATGAAEWGFSNAGGAIGQLNAGEVNFKDICVSFTGAETVSCHLQ